MPRGGAGLVDGTLRVGGRVRLTEGAACPLAAVDRLSPLTPARLEAESPT